MSKILDNPTLSKKQRAKRRSRRLWAATAIAFALVVVCYVLIARSGYWLVQDDEFEHVSWVVVLDGQSADMERTDFAAGLLKSRRADSLLVLGRRVYRDKCNADFYGEDMMRTGDLDSTRVFLFCHNDPSTLEEAVSVIPWLKVRNADTVLLVTETPVTARASYLFNSLSGGHPYFKTIDIKSHSFAPANWLQEREARKWWLREMAANFVARLDLMFADTLFVDSSKLKTFSSMRDAALQKEPELVVMTKPDPQKQIVEDTAKVAVDTSATETVQKAMDSVKVEEKNGN